jgi:regulatory protein
MRRRQVSRYSRGGVEESTPPFGMDAAPDDPNKRRNAARNTAIGLLARREHAESEIRRKLRDRGYDADLTLEVVDELTRQRLLSDERFAEAFIRSRAERGQGPVRLRAELRQLHVPTELIERHLTALDVDWSELAGGVRRRKFGDREPIGLSERAKQVRFLQYRGFTADQIRAALRQAAIKDDVDELLVADDSDSPHDRPEN